MELIYTDNLINIINNKKKIVTTVENNEYTKYFIENWYFLNHYCDKDKYKNSFIVNFK